MGDVLSVAVSGLRSHQIAIQTTGHNISNVNTPGYNRQVVDFDTQIPNKVGNVFVGNGVTVAGIRRIVDEFAVAQVRSDTTAFNEFDTFFNKAGLLDQLLADPNTGITGAINDFFAAMNVAANDPSSIPARQVVLASAGSLADRFQSIQQRLSSIENTVNQEFESITSTVNELARTIGELNAKITASAGLPAGQQPNDFLDQRDQALRELSELIGVQVVTEPDNNQVNVFVGNGQPLVIGNLVNEFDIAPSEDDRTETAIFLNVGSQRLEVTDQLTGGQLGGLVRFREEGLGNTENELGRIAVGLAALFNEQHQLGMDLDDELGGLFFTDVNSTALAQDRVVPDPGNAQPQDGVIEVRIDDVGALTTSDYRLEFDGSAGPSSFRVFRESDGAEVAQGSLGALPQVLTVDGLEITFASGNFAEGDSFALKPTRNAATNIEVELVDPRDLALAMPIRGQENPANRGTGLLSQGEVIDVTTSAFTTQSLTATPPLRVVFNDPPTTYDIQDISDPLAPVTLLAGQAFVPGQKNEIFSTDDTLPFPQYTGFKFSISGTPAANDEFDIEYNNGGVSDNRNALKYVELATVGIFDGGSVTLTEAYARLISRVGNDAAESRIGRDASESLLRQSENILASSSGVNLDEEAANLIRFEQAYNASAQVINVARTLFDTIIAAVR